MVKQKINIDDRKRICLDIIGHLEESIANLTEARNVIVENKTLSDRNINRLRSAIENIPYRDTLPDEDTDYDDDEATEPLQALLLTNMHIREVSTRQSPLINYTINELQELLSQKKEDYENLEIEEEVMLFSTII